MSLGREGLTETGGGVGPHVDVLPLSVPERWFDDPEDDAWAFATSDHLGGGGSVTLSLAANVERCDSEMLIRRARQVLRVVRDLLCEQQALPRDTYVEVDEESFGTPTAPGNEARFLLPHHDGGHASFPTPRAINDAYGISKTRLFSKTVFFKRHSHKMYQGFLITEPGTFPGETYYYSVFSMLFDAYLHKNGARPGSLDQLESFLGDNINRSLSQAGVHRSRYLTMSATLGSADLAHHILPSGPREESEFWPEQYAHVRQLWSQVEACPCGSCRGPGGRIMCSGMTEVLGLTWPAARERYERKVVGRRGDLLLGNNLFQWHAAYSAPDRRICPVCIVSDKPGGPAYERWLATQWTQGFQRAEAG